MQQPQARDHQNDAPISLQLGLQSRHREFKPRCQPPKSVQPQVYYPNSPRSQQQTRMDRRRRPLGRRRSEKLLHHLQLKTLLRCLQRSATKTLRWWRISSLVPTTTRLPLTTLTSRSSSQIPAFDYRASAIYAILLTSKA